MYANVHGTRLFFDVGGAGYVARGSRLVEQPVILVLHGGPGCDHSNFKPWLAQHAQLVYVDHRGNGRLGGADESTYTVEQMADDVEGLRTHLGLGPVVVLGHSFGGMVAQVYAIRHPQGVRGLVLSSTAPSAQFWDEAQGMADRMATSAQKEVLNDLFEGRIASQEEFDDWWRICLPLYFRDPDPVAIEETLDRMRGRYKVANYMMATQIPGFDVRDRLPSVVAPALVLSGRYDWVTPGSQSEVITKALPSATHVTFERSGHMSLAEENDIYVRHVTDFLARLQDCPA